VHGLPPRPDATNGRSGLPPSLGDVYIGCAKGWASGSGVAGDEVLDSVSVLSRALMAQLA
jgi:hypothetical protein